MNARPRRWMRILLSCVLLAFTSGALANASAAVGIVLCVGLDGHIAIESARGPDCTGTTDHAARDTQTPDAGAKAAVDCGDCLDLALANTASAVSSTKREVTAAREVDDPPVLPLLLLASFHAPPVIRSLGIPPAYEAPLPDLKLLAHRTDVLLV